MGYEKKIHVEISIKCNLNIIIKNNNKFVVVGVGYSSIDSIYKLCRAKEQK